MKGLEIVALIILAILFGAKYIPIKGFKGKGFRFLYFISVIIIYPLFIQGTFIFYNWLYNFNVYPTKLFSHISGETNYSWNLPNSTWIWHSGMRHLIFKDDLILDYKILSVVYLIISVSLYFLLFRRNALIRKFKNIIGVKNPINLKVLIVLSFFLTFLIKPFYSYNLDPIEIDTEKCKAYSTLAGYCGEYFKEPAELKHYFKLFGDAGIIEYRKIDLVISFFIALVISFSTIKVIKLIPSTSTFKGKKPQEVEAKIRVLKDLLEAGAITEEEYKVELRKLKDQFI